jgi:hypothetical protein
VSHGRNIDFLEKIWVGLAAALKIPKAYHRENLISCRKLCIGIKSDRSHARHRRIEPHDHHVVHIGLRVVVGVLDALNDCASLSSIDGLAGLIGTHDNTSREVATVAVGGGENDVSMDETGSTTVLPLDEVRVLSLGGLVSSDDATCLISARISFLDAVESTFLFHVMISVAGDCVLGRNGC